MTKTTINIDNIESIILIDKKEHNRIQWIMRERKEWNWKKFKFQIIQTYGYYDKDYDFLMYGEPESKKDNLLLTLNQLKETYPEVIVEDGIVYRKPKVKITLKSGDFKKKEFNNLNEADLYYQALNRKLTNKTEL